MTVASKEIKYALRAAAVSTSGGFYAASRMNRYLFTIPRFSCPVRRAPACVLESCVAAEEGDLKGKSRRQGRKSGNPH